MESACLQDLARGRDVLRVTTFNLLAPVWTHASVYPSMDMAVFDPALRRKRQRQRLLELDAEVVLLQEVQSSELRLLLQEEDGVLQTAYDVEFCAFPPGLWKGWLLDGSEPQETGVAVLTKCAAIVQQRTEKVPLAGGVYANLVFAQVPAWDDAEILIATSHLDVESFFCSKAQSRQMAELLKQHVDTQAVEAVIWGGDFNMELRSSSMQGIVDLGFHATSASPTSPSAFTVYWPVRLDHILVYEGVASNGIELAGSFLPTCPLKNKQARVLPLMSELHWFLSCAFGYGGVLRRIFATLMAPLALLLLLPALLSVLQWQCNCESLRWAIEHWGSDHLPVTVALRRQGEKRDRFPSSSTQCPSDDSYDVASFSSDDGGASDFEDCD
eukprot:TRINITY_DN75891_c0_g1_i1.p1 TRINITY_DN75891_c0_g1~~TRINITY_DN75891_c0_g1_i1.p1  ORF type:complete len:385 (-),score=68.60 TRINITY_DN75891_c0_g1_i1:90-1244(-)